MSSPKIERFQCMYFITTLLFNFTAEFPIVQWRLTNKGIMSSLSRFGEVITPVEAVNTLANHILMVTLEQYIMCFRERERERERGRECVCMD